MLAWKQPFIQRVRNSSLVEGLRVDNNRVSNLPPKLWDATCIGRGAFRGRRMRGVSPAGARGKANVGISNDKEGAMPSRRKTKVSWATLIGPGSVGT